MPLSCIFSPNISPEYLLLYVCPARRDIGTSVKDINCNHRYLLKMTFLLHSLIRKDPAFPIIVSNFIPISSQQMQVLIGLNNVCAQPSRSSFEDIFNERCSKTKYMDNPVLRIRLIGQKHFKGFFYFFFVFGSIHNLQTTM